MIHAEVLFHIADTLEARKSADPKSSYVSELLHKGEDAVLKKVAEEAAEVLMASKTAASCIWCVKWPICGSTRWCC